MRKLIYTLSLFVLFTCSSVKAQQYNTHRVKSGETIESIAKKYKVTVSDIYKLNPDAKGTLSANALLIIPRTGKVIIGSTSTNNEQVAEKTIDRFIVHKTKRKETLFSISQEYKVEIEAIKKHNKFLYANNLRKGDRLQIPVYKKVISIQTVPETTTTTTTTSETVSSNATYVVQPLEGKWRIAYKYGITVQELEALNPNIGGLLQPGQIINVPNLETEKVKQVDQRFSYYKVLPAEGFYRLKVKLGLEQETLEGLNPELKTTGLKVGMILKVPFDTAINSIENTNNTNIGAQTTTVIDNISNMESVKLSNKVSDFSVKNIAVMLPFTLNEMNTDSISDVKQKIKTDITLGITLDFYSGVMVAFDSLKKLGINLKVDVYDTQNRLSEVNSILRNKDFTSTHAVIGPLLTNNFNATASALRLNNIPVISPIVKTVGDGPNVFQSRPSDEQLKNKIISHFKGDSTANIVVVSDLKSRAESTALKGKFTRVKTVNSRTDKKTGKDAYYILGQDLISVIKPGNNVVFLETDNAGFVSNVTSILNGLKTDKTNITLTTTTQNKVFEDDVVSNYHLSNLNFTYASISKMLSSETNNSFVKHYKQQYDISPNTYAIRGFDLTMDVVLRLVTAQDLYTSVIQTPLTSYIENKFAYTKKAFEGYYNESVYIVHYKDLEIVEVE